MNATEHTASGSASGNAADEALELERHCRNIAPDVLEGRVVPVLGAGVNLCERPEPFEWKPESPYLPSAAELAEHLADRSAYTPDLYRPRADVAEGVADQAEGVKSQHTYEPVFDLLRVSQYVEVLKGSVDLYRALHEVFDDEYEPSIVHRFLAQLTKVVGEPLLVVTTNYDFALEDAFRDAQVAYDLVTYVTDYPRNKRGRFTHSRWTPGQTDGEPEPKVITSPNKYTAVGHDLPAIVKIHGAARREGHYTQDNYVISEDDYIDYLMRPNTTSLLPVTIRERLSESHFLFLGYSLRDWNLRVILRRIWEAQWLSARSWSVRLDADEMDEIFWHQQGVITLRQPLLEYTLALRRACVETFLDGFADDSPEHRQETLAKTRPETLFEPITEDDRQALADTLPPEQLKVFLDELPKKRREQLQAALPETLLARVRAIADTGSPGE